MKWQYYQINNGNINLKLLAQSSQEYIIFSLTSKMQYEVLLTVLQITNYSLSNIT